MTRHALARRFASALLSEEGEPATLDGLAGAAGVSVPTVRHYFKDKDGAFRAALRAVREDGAARLQAMGEPGDRSAAECVFGLALAVPLVWRRFGLGRLMASGLALGIGNATRGPAFLEELLEPFLQAAEMLFRELARTRRLKPLDPRGTALALLAPILFALIHQDYLGGHQQRPLEMTRFARAHAARILRSLGVSDAKRAKRPRHPRTPGRSRHSPSAR